MCMKKFSAEKKKEKKKTTTFFDKFKMFLT